MMFNDATLCVKGDLAYTVIPCRWIEVEIVPYAQHLNAVRVTYLAKGKRRERVFVQTFEPSLVVLRGHVALDLPDPFRSGPGGLQISRAQSLDPVWAREFQEALDAGNAEVLADYRGHKVQSKF